MGSLVEKVRQLGPVARPGAVSLTALAVVSGLGLWLGTELGASVSQTTVGLIAPAVIMCWFFLSARARIGEPTHRLDHDEWPIQLDLERARSRALSELILSSGYQLPVHRERCSLRAEALAVAVEYRSFDREVKVVVPDLLAMTDPSLLRLGLQVLLDNAIRHGGARVAVWAAEEQGRVMLTVSDDGPGLPPDLERLAFRRLVDLDRPDMVRSPNGNGLSLARTVAERLGGELSYRRDATWSHFTISIPSMSPVRQPVSHPAREEAGVR